MRTQLSVREWREKFDGALFGTSLNKPLCELADTQELLAIRGADLNDLLADYSTEEHRAESAERKLAEARGILRAFVDAMDHGLSSIADQAYEWAKEIIAEADNA